MKTYRINYRNTSLKESNVERLQNDIKNMYWEKGKEPEDWKEFCGDIEINSLQYRRGDCVELVVNDKMEEPFADSIIDGLIDNAQIMLVEKKINDFEYEPLNSF